MTKDEEEQHLLDIGMYKDKEGNFWSCHPKKPTMLFWIDLLFVSLIMVAFPLILILFGIIAVDTAISFTTVVLLISTIYLYYRIINMQFPHWPDSHLPQLLYLKEKHKWFRLPFKIYTLGG